MGSSIEEREFQAVVVALTSASYELERASAALRHKGHNEQTRNLTATAKWRVDHANNIMRRMLRDNFYPEKDQREIDELAEHSAGIAKEGSIALGRMALKKARVKLSTRPSPVPAYNFNPPQLSEELGAMGVDDDDQ